MLNIFQNIEAIEQEKPLITDILKMQMIAALRVLCIFHQIGNAKEWISDIILINNRIINLNNKTKNLNNLPCVCWFTGQLSSSPQYPPLFTPFQQNHTIL